MEDAKVTNSQEWVYHERGSGDPSLVRLKDKAAWDSLFKHISLLGLTYELNNKWLAHGTELVAFDASNPKDFIFRAQQLLNEIGYSIDVTKAPLGTLKVVSQQY